MKMNFQVKIKATGRLITRRLIGLSNLIEATDRKEQVQGRSFLKTI